MLEADNIKITEMKEKWVGNISEKTRKQALQKTIKGTNNFWYSHVCLVLSTNY